MAIKPRGLNKCSTIGIIAPASPCYSYELIEKGIKLINNIGFKTVLGNSVDKRCGYLAGDDYIRSSDINSFFERSDIDGIICLRGGYGTLRLLDLIDYRSIINNPKVFMGYSDITAIHIAINKFCNMVTFHGPMVTSDFGCSPDEYTLNSFLDAVMVKSKSYAEEKFYDMDILCPGQCAGAIIGGNLTVIVSTIGTPYEIETEGRILLIEEVGEEPYRIDRMLTQLILSGKLQRCAGIVLGQWTDCQPKESEKSLSLIEVLKDRLSLLGIPVLYNGSFGHEKSKATIPLGVSGMITKDGKFIIYEEGVL